SWTGLRIGLTAAKTLALSFQIPLIGIPTFDIVARATETVMQDDALLLVQAPCRPGERYAKLWHRHGAECDLLEPEFIGTLEQITQRLEAAARQYHVNLAITASPNGEILELPEMSLAVN